VKLLEYRGKTLLARAGVPIPRGTVAATVDEAVAAVAGYPDGCVLKSQVQMGGRGKAGGIVVLRPGDDARGAAGGLFEKRLVGPQSPGGEVVRTLLVEELLDIASEAYVAISIDRAKGVRVALASARGGMAIEEVAAEDPGAVVRRDLDAVLGVRPYVGRELAFAASLPPEVRKAFPDVLAALYDASRRFGATLVEINPLVLTRAGVVVAGDAKIELDDNVLGRLPELAAWRDDEDEGERDALAGRAIGLPLGNFARFAGSIGILANGAGLGMATMDALVAAGGSAANFLDVGGGAGSELVHDCFRLVLEDPRVRVVFVNIFGGITRCDLVAEGIVAASATLHERGVPLVVRLTGTREAEGRAILEAARIETVPTMDEGARRAAELAA